MRKKESCQKNDSCCSSRRDFIKKVSGIILATSAYEVFSFLGDSKKAEAAEGWTAQCITCTDCTKGCTACTSKDCTSCTGCISCTSACQSCTACIMDTK